MEVGLSAITFYLASASSPVAATTMDREPGSRAEGEAVAASGAAAAAAFRDSARQVGEGGGGGAEAEAGRAQPPLCLVRPLQLWLVGLPRSRPPAGGALRVSSSGSPPRLRNSGLEAGNPRQPLRWQRLRLWGGLGFPGATLRPQVCEQENAGVSPKGGLSGWRPGDAASITSQSLRLQAPGWACARCLANSK